MNATDTPGIVLAPDDTMRVLMAKPIRGRLAGLRLVRETPIPGAVAPDRRESVRSPKDVVAMLTPYFQREPDTECFAIIPLDAQHRAIFDGPVVVTRGILNSSLVHPREVFKAAIVAGAAALILAHNHPSGDPTPSADDRNVTDQLVAAGRLLDLPVHDHIIIGDGRYTSFAEAGLL